MSIKNKSNYIICSIVLILVVFMSVGYFSNKTPFVAPTLKVITDDNEFYADKNGCNWNNESSTGTKPTIFAHKIKSHIVPKNSELKLILSNDKNIQNFNIKQITELDDLNYKTIDMTNSNRTITTPNTEGEYNYYIYAGWKNDYYVDYMIKIKVE